MANTKEKHSDLDSSTDDVTKSAENGWAPIRPQESRRGRGTDRDVRIIRTRSQNGYGCEDNEREEAGEKQADGEEDPFEVGWDDGENDPMNPRSNSKATKWAIVIICSFSSFCVTCTSSIYTST